MNHEDDQDREHSPDHWFSSFEAECFDELESQSRVEPRLQTAEELAAQQLWLGFQQTSTAIAQLYNYKGSVEDGYVLLVPFNKAAESLTKLYKDSLNNARECLRLGLQNGRSSRTRDIVAWARKKRKCIRRDELLAFLCGKTMPSHSNHHKFRPNKSIDRQMARFNNHQTETTDMDEYSFGNGLALQGLNSSMPTGYSRHSPTTSSTPGFNRSPAVDEFIIHEDKGRASSEHRKRNNSSSAMDVCMDSPSRKRGKFL